MQESLTLITTRHSIHFERLKTTEVKKFDDFLKNMDKDIRNQLNTGTDITELSRSKMEAQLKLIGSLLNDSFSEYEKVWRQSVRETSIYEAGFEKRALEKVVDGVNFQLPSDYQIQAAVFAQPIGDIGGVATGSLLAPYFKNITDAQIAKIQGAIRIGYSEGQTTNEIIRRIRGTRAAGFSDGIISGTYRAVEGMTRTALQHAAQTARESVWEKNDDVIKAVRILSTIDKKTSKICRLLDGKEFPVGKGQRPPFHINCRTTTVAVLKKEYAELSRGRRRKARDPNTGKVENISANQTYYDWLKKQPASFQDSVVGKTRGKLLRDGGLSAERFTELQLNKNFQPLETITKNGKKITPLEQMRQLEPLAFEKAGL